MQALHASDLLDTFTAAGLVLSLTPDSALKVTPAKALNEDLRAAIKANKAMLVDYLQRTAANDTTPATDPDRWCWPHSEAMNGQEIDTFTARLARFTDKGASLEEAAQAVFGRRHDARYTLVAGQVIIGGSEFRPEPEG